MRIRKDEILIRDFTESDLTLLLKWLTDDRVLEFYEGRDVRFTGETLAAHFLEEIPGGFRVIFEYGDTPIGYGQAYRLSGEMFEEYDYPDDGRVVFAMDQFIGEPDYWSRGIGTSFLRIMADYLKNDKAADVILLDPHQNNFRAIRAYEKTGFRIIRPLPEHEMFEGKKVDCWLMELNLNIPADRRQGTMFDLNRYLDDLIRGCREAFGDRLVYAGLQGSWLRGEAREGSDIDVMVVLDRFGREDMDRYREILQSIGEYERSCGFLCGKDELLRWSPLETCQLLHTTKDLVGVLADLVPPYAREDEIEYVRFSLGNVYQELCHRFVHADREKNTAKFRGTCKYVFFLVQNLHFLESGRFLLTRRELKEDVSAEDREVLVMAELPDGFDFDRAFETLFAWCQEAFARLEKLEQA